MNEAAQFVKLCKLFILWSRNIEKFNVLES